MNTRMNRPDSHVNDGMCSMGGVMSMSPQLRIWLQLVILIIFAIILILPADVV